MATASNIRKNPYKRHLIKNHRKIKRSTSCCSTTCSPLFIHQKQYSYTMYQDNYCLNKWYWLLNLVLLLAPGPSTATPLNGCLVKVIGKDKTTFALPFPHCRISEQWGTAIMGSVETLPISFSNIKRTIAMHYGTVDTVNVIENMNYRNNLNSILLETNYTNRADANYIAIGY